MSRTRIACSLLAASLVAASAWAGPIAEHHRSGPSTVTGTYSITFNLNIVSTLPAGATIACRVQIVPATSGMPGFTPQSAPSLVESASGVASVSGSTATCEIEIPFSWTVQSTRGGASLSYQIDAFNATGSLPTVLRSSAQQEVAEPYPSSSGTSTLSFNVTF